MTSPRRPPGRYDEPRGPLPRPVRLGGAAVLGLLLVALAVTASQRFGEGRASVGVLGFRTLGDRAVEVRFEVHKDPGATVFCRVRARNSDGLEVGTEEVPVGPSDRGVVVVVHRLATSDRPSTGEVDGCSETRRSPRSPSGSPSP